MKRFYEAVSIAEADAGWQVALDGRGVKTVGGAPQVVPARSLAHALAAEWEDQGERIDPAGFRLRDLADYAIDVIARDPAPHIAGILRFAETDTLLYRADPDEPLHERQQAVWEPIVRRFEAREGLALTRVSGIVHRPQPDAALAALKARLEAMDPFALAGTQMLASLAASLVAALEAGEADADASALWQAASLEEEWQAQLWGRDEEAEDRRKAREGQFIQASEWVRMASA